MQSQRGLAERFRALHHGDTPFILANVWDPLSAAIVAEAGLPAIATASAAVALSRGFDDREKIPFGELIELVERIAQTVDVPVSVDFERGYGSIPEEVHDNTLALLDAGAIGVNIEDSIDNATLRSIDEQYALIQAVRNAGLAQGVHIFINARTDVFMLGGAVNDGIERLRAYAEAGADGVYPIMCADLTVLEHIHRATERPINVLLTPSNPPLDSLTAAGVRRLSMGPDLLSIAAGTTAEAVRRLAEGDILLEDLPRLTTADMRRIQGITPQH
jgi:2-methylisocitrate lyase-like PEP mutase family enzyme